MSATNRTINTGFLFYKLARAVGNAGRRLATALVATIFAVIFFCQTPDLGQGLEFDFTFAKNKNKNPHLNFQ